MPIDMDNMLPGFSSQLVSSQTTPTLGNAGAAGGGAVDTTYLVTALLRDEEILDVGFTVAGVGDGTDYTVSFQSVGSATKVYVSTTTVTGNDALGTVIRVANAGLAWNAAADTEAERILKRGDSMQFIVDGTGSATALIVPFVIMRGAEPLDPIA